VISPDRFGVIPVALISNRLLIRRGILHNGYLIECNAFLLARLHKLHYFHSGTQIAGTVVPPYCFCMADKYGRKRKYGNGYLSERFLQDMPEGARKGEYMMKQRGKLLLIAVVCALMVPLILAGTASAKYVGDGIVQNPTTGAWEIPDYGQCVTTIKSDGTFVTDATKTTLPECATVDFREHTTSAACSPANPTTADKHFWASTCLANGGPLDNTLIPIYNYSTRNQAGCTAAAIAAGATSGSYAARCTGSWTITEIGPGAGGFCYTTINVTDAVGYGTAAECVTIAHGQGFAWTSSQCRYSYGIYGKNTATPAVTVSPQSYTTQAACLYAGFSWNPYIQANGAPVLISTTLPEGGSYIQPAKGSSREGCAKCHNNKYLPGNPEFDVGETVAMTGHKNMLRKVTPGTPLLGPDGVAMTHDASNNPINWATGQVTVGPNIYDLVWMYGDWIDVADPVYGHRMRSVYKNPSATTAGSYSCGRCHATGWSSDSVLQSAKEPERSFPGITRTSTLDNVNKINLAGGITGYASETMSSWDEWGIKCTRCHTTSQTLETPLSITTGTSLGTVDNERKKSSPWVGQVNQTSGHGGLPSPLGPGTTRLCTECHRQETGGLPYTWFGTLPNGTVVADRGFGLDPSTVLVGPYHNTITVISHPAGNQFLNSPHAKFTGTWDNVITIGSYASNFMKPVASGGMNESGCMGCHNIHQSLVVAEHTEPFFNECTTCHTKSIAGMLHPVGGETPAGLSGGNANVACEACHMPEGLHLWRINTNAAYSTFPVGAASANAKANTSPDGTYAQAAWVDLDIACGKCHGGGSAHYATTGTMAALSSTITVADATGFAPGVRIRIAGARENGADWDTYVKSVTGDVVTVATPPTGTQSTAAVSVTNAAVEVNPTAHGAGYINKTVLAAYAAGIHNDNPTARFSFAKDGLAVTFDASQSICPSGNCGYSWAYGGAGVGPATGVNPTFTYAAGGTYNVTLTVTDISSFSSGTKTVNGIDVAPNNAAPVAGCTKTANANTWTLSIVDSSTDDAAFPANAIKVNWADGSPLASGNNLASFGPKQYVNAGTYNVSLKAVDAGGLNNTSTCGGAVTFSNFLISGKVTQSNGTTAISSATVKLTRVSGVGTFSPKTTYTASNGNYSFTGLKPGTYTVTVTKSPYVFPTPPTATVGANATVNISANP